jgi:hypothetical protein
VHRTEGRGRRRGVEQEGATGGGAKRPCCSWCSYEQPQLIRARSGPRVAPAVAAGWHDPARSTGLQLYVTCLQLRAGRPPASARGGCETLHEERCGLDDDDCANERATRCVDKRQDQCASAPPDALCATRRRDRSPDRPRGGAGEQLRCAGSLPRLSSAAPLEWVNADSGGAKAEGSGCRCERRRHHGDIGRSGVTPR